MRAVKVIIVGDTDTGKTCLTTRLIGGQWTEKPEATVQSAFHQFTAGDLTFHLWDTAGQERFQSLGQTYYRDARVALFCFAINERSSFEHIANWRRNVDVVCPDVRRLLVGTKSDLEGVVPQSEAADAAAAMDGSFILTSALHSIGIDDLKQEVITAGERLSFPEWQGVPEPTNSACC